MSKSAPKSALVSVAFMAFLAPAAASAQVTQAPAGTPAQRQAISALDRLDGRWVGEAQVSGPGGKIALTQTERVGSLLGGSIKVIEGRGYAADGTTAFNAFAVVSWDEAAKAYRFRSWAQGHEGDFPFELTADGFRWEIPAGPGKVKYVATVKDGVWHEVGDYVMEGRPPMRVIEMTLKRAGDSDWPAAGAVEPAATR